MLRYCTDILSQQKTTTHNCRVRNLLSSFCLHTDTYSLQLAPNTSLATKKKMYLVKSLGRRHGRLDNQGANVLPSLLQQADQVVDGQHDVGDELVLSHSDISDSNTHTQDLLQLELDGRLDISHLVVEILGVGDRGGEFSSCKTKDSCVSCSSFIV